MTSPARLQASGLAQVVPLRRQGTGPQKVPAKPSEPPDPKILEAILAGDVEAQTWLWDRFSKPVRAVLRRTLGPGVDVEDALQEVFLQFFRSARSIRDPGAVGSFLIGVAVRVARSELRRRRFRRWFSLTRDGELPEPAHDDDPAAEHAREAVRSLYAILDDLDDESRLLFVLRHIEKLELTEVAQAASMSLATVKRRLVRVTPLVIARAKRDPALCAYVATDAAEQAPEDIRAGELADEVGL